MIQSVRVVGYLRRSTLTRQEQSLEIQRTEIVAFCQANGYVIVDWYIDDGISGGIEHRPGFQLMIADAEGRKFDRVVCLNQSRFSRMKPLRSAEYMSRLDRHHVQLMTVAEGLIDPDDIGGWIKCQVEAFGNHKFLETIANDTIKGQLRKVLSGSIAGQRAPYGLDRMYCDTNGKQVQRVKIGQKLVRDKSWSTTLVLSDDLELVERVRWMFHMYDDEEEHGSGWIANELNNLNIPAPNGGKWNQSTISSILSNPCYAGRYRWNRRRYGKYACLKNGTAAKRDQTEIDGDVAEVIVNSEKEQVLLHDAFEALIDPVLFDRIQEKIKSKTRGTARHQQRNAKDRVPYLLRKLVFCADCDEKMHGSAGKYVCSTYVTKGKDQCNHNTAKRAKLEARVIRLLTDFLQSPDWAELIETTVRQEIARLAEPKPQPRQADATRLKELEATCKRLVRDLGECRSDEMADLVKDELQSVIDEKNALKKAMASKEMTLQRILDADEMVAEAMAFAATETEQLLSSDAVEARKVIDRLVERIDVTFREEKSPNGKRTFYRPDSIELKLLAESIESSYSHEIAGTGFEPATSRL